MNRNIYIPDNDAEDVEIFITMFHRSASAMLVKFMKESVVKFAKYKNEIIFGHANKDQRTVTPYVFYGKQITDDKWELNKNVIVFCKIFLLFSGAYLISWCCKPSNNEEYTYWDYRIMEKPAKDLSIVFSNEKPNTWKLAGYKKIPNSFPIPQDFLDIAQENTDLILEQCHDWPDLRP